MLFLPPGPSTIQEALELASHIRDVRSTYVRPASKTRGVRQAQIEVPDNATQSDSDITALKHWVRYFVENSFQTQHRRTSSSKVRAETECWFCHKKGHWARECHQKPQNWPDWLKVLWSAHEWSKATAAKNLTHPKEVEQILKEFQKLKDQLGQEAKKRSDVGSAFSPRQVSAPKPPTSQPQGGTVARTITYNYADGTSDTTLLPPVVSATVRRIRGLPHPRGRGRGRNREEGVQSQSRASCGMTQPQYVMQEPVQDQPAQQPHPNR